MDQVSFQETKRFVDLFGSYLKVVPPLKLVCHVDSKDKSGNPTVLAMSDLEGLNGGKVGLMEVPMVLWIVDAV